MSGPFYPGQRVVAVNFPSLNGKMARVVNWQKGNRWLNFVWMEDMPNWTPGKTYGVFDHRFRPFEGELSPVERYIADELGAALD